MPFTVQPVDTVPDFGPPGATGATKFSVVPVDAAPDFGDAPTAAGGPGAFSRGFVHTLLQENPGALADALEGASYLLGDQEWAGGLRDTAVRIRAAAQAPAQYAPQSGGIGDLWDNPSISRALTYLGESAGGAIGSTLPSMAGGTAGAIVGGRLAGKPGAAVGALGGATLPAGGMNYGGMYRALVDEGVKPEVAAKWAGAAAVPITALDVAPVAGWAERIAGQGAKQEVQRAFAKRILQEALKGGLAEGLTEGAQQVIQERVAADVTGTDFWTPERMRNILDNAIGGALAGGAFGGASGIRKDHVAPSPTLQVEPLALPPPSIPMPDRSQPPPPPQGLLPSARTAGALPPPERTYGEGFTMREGRPGEGYEPPPTGLPAPPELLRLENGGTPLLPAPERTYGSGFSVIPVDTAPDFGEPRKQFRPPEPELIEGQRTPAQRFSIEPVDVAPDFGERDRTSFDDVVASIHKQESGGRDTAKTSVTGARGGMQIQPATFAQYARPGESIDRPEDNMAVGRRIIADLWQKSGGDPARVAVGYFSGPGNIAPVGAATPWKRDAADPTGKTTSSYVEDVLKRLGRGGLPWIGQDEPKRKEVEFAKLPDQTPAPSLAQIEAALLGQQQDQPEDVAAPLREAISPSQEESIAPPGAIQPLNTALTFRTERGSQYAVDGARTRRNKAARPEHPGDSGIKNWSDRTVYVDGDTAREIGAWQTLSARQKKIRINDDGTITLLSEGPGGKLGRDPTVASMKWKPEPEVGAHPLEVWAPSKSVPGAYTGNHPGNKIVSIQPAYSPDTRGVQTPASQKPAQNIPENIPGSGVAGASATKAENQPNLSTGQLPAGTPVRVRLQDGTYADNGATGKVTGYVPGKRPRVQLEGFTGLKAPFADLVTLEPIEEGGKASPQGGASAVSGSRKALQDAVIDAAKMDANSAGIEVRKVPVKNVFDATGGLMAFVIDDEGKVYDIGTHDIFDNNVWPGTKNGYFSGGSLGTASIEGSGLVKVTAHNGDIGVRYLSEDDLTPEQKRTIDAIKLQARRGAFNFTEEAAASAHGEEDLVDALFHERAAWRGAEDENPQGGGASLAQPAQPAQVQPTASQQPPQYRSEDFTFARRGSTASPWAVVHRQSGQIVDLPVEFDHPDIGKTTIGKSFFKTKAEARAALDRRLQEQPTATTQPQARVAPAVEATPPSEKNIDAFFRAEMAWQEARRIGRNKARAKKSMDAAENNLGGWRLVAPGSDQFQHAETGEMVSSRELRERAQELVRKSAAVVQQPPAPIAPAGKREFKAEATETVAQNEGDGEVEKFRDKLDKFGAARSQTADYKISESNAGALELTRTRDGKRDVIASGERASLLDRATKDAFSSRDGQDEGDLEAAIARGQEAAKEHAKDVTKPTPDVLLQVYGQFLSAHGLGPKAADPHDVMRFFDHEKQYDGGLTPDDLRKNFEVYAAARANAADDLSLEPDRGYSSIRESRETRVRVAEAAAKHYEKEATRLDGWLDKANAAETVNPGSEAAKRIRAKVDKLQKEAILRAEESRAKAEAIEREPFTERQPGWQLLTEATEKPINAGVVQVAKVGNKFYAAGGYYSNGHLILKDGQLPNLRKRLASEQGEPTQVPEDKLLGYVNKKKGSDEFVPSIEYNPKADPSANPKATSVVYGKVGAKAAAVNGIYYHFLTNSGVKIKGVTDVGGAPLFDLWRGNAKIGALAGINEKAATRELADAQAKLAQEEQPKASLFGAWRSPRDRDRIAKRVVEIVRQIAPQTNVEIANDLSVRVGGRDLPGGGQFDPVRNLVTVALNFGDPEITAGHEAVHALRNAGLFTPQEWATLEKAAKDRWIDELGVRDIYRGVSDDVVTEEAIAQRFAEWRKQPAKELPAVRRAFTKIRDFFRRLANALRGMGFRTPEDVFEAAERGDVGRRVGNISSKSQIESDYPTSSDPSARASLFNTLKRQAAPVLKQPAQKPGTNAQKSAVDRIFGTGHTPLRERVRAAIRDYSDRQFLKAKQAILDQFASVKALERETRGGIAPGSRSPHKSVRLTRNLHSVMAYVLRHGPIAVGKQKDGGVWFGRLKGWDKGGFEDIFKPIAEKGLLDLWEGWAVAVRSEQLAKEGRERLISDADRALFLPLGGRWDEVSGRFVGPAQYPEFQTAFRKWQAFNKAMLDMAESAGLINAEQRALWERSDYIPFYRTEVDKVIGPKRGNPGVANQRSPVSRLFGGESKLNPPIENMVMNMTSLVDRSFKNLAARKVVALALEAGAMTREKYDWRKDQVTPEDAARELERIGVQVTGMTPQQHAQMLNFWRMQAPTDPDVISVMVGGKPQFFRVHDPMLLQSLTSMTPQQLTGVLGIFRAAKRLLTEAITIDPAFMAANGLRDTLAAYVTTGQKGFRPFVDSLRGFRKALDEDDPIKLDIMANGGGLAGFYGTSPEDARKYIERHVGRLGVESIMDTPRKLWEGWHKIGQASEGANRIAIAEAVKKNGGSEAEQAFQGMDLLDFGMRGASATMRILIETIPFLNARVQGLYRLGRGAKENPKAFLLRGSIIAAASLALLAENWDNPEYEKLEDWDKDTYWHLWVDGVHLRLPKPFEVGALFGTIPERMARAYFGKEDMQAAWKATKFMLHSTFQIDMPQLFAPLVEQWANRDTFTGRAIVGADLEKLPAWMQYRPDTSATAVETGAALNKVLPKELESLSSPERIEHLVGGYFGTLGMYLLTLSDQAVRLAGDYPSNPTLRIDDIPVVKRFIRADPQRNTRFLTEFYDLKNEVDKTASAVRELGKRGETDDAEKYVEERAGDLAAAKVLDKAAKAMTKLRLSEQSIMRDRQMTPAQKRKAIDEITTDRNAMAEEFVGYAKTLRVMNGIANAP